jgi:uncharacterized membrane protein YkvA (DUF1232 family)
MGFFADIKAKAKLLKRQSMVLYYAVRDPRTPLGVKFLAGAIVAYALSPIDLIPDFIPVLGYLDEVILLPMAIAFALKLLPEAVLQDAKAQAETALNRPKSYKAAVIIVLIWIALAVVFTVWMMKVLNLA